MKEVLSEIEVWKARGDRIALATVIDVQRSAPRPPGAKMAVNEHGEIAGSVSGGCVEGAVAEIADGILRGDPPQLVHFGIADSDAWDVGLPCGGEIDVWVQAYDPGRFEEVARADGRAAEVTVLEGASPGAKLLVEADGARQGSLGAPELDDEAARVAIDQLWAETSERRDGLFIDVVGPAPRLLVSGAVDIAASLCTLARAAGWRPYVIDPRARIDDIGPPSGGTRERAQRGRDVNRAGHEQPRRRSDDVDEQPIPSLGRLGPELVDGHAGGLVVELGGAERALPGAVGLDEQLRPGRGALEHGDLSRAPVRACDLLEPAGVIRLDPHIDLPATGKPDVPRVRVGDPEVDELRRVSDREG